MSAAPRRRRSGSTSRRSRTCRPISSPRSPRRRCGLRGYRRRVKIRRVGAYGLCRDDHRRVLLARNSGASEFPGLWGLPGGGVEQGEHPDDTVLREFREETGLDVRAMGLHDVTADVSRLPSTGDLEHIDRIIYDVEPYGGELRNEVAGTTDLVGWAG